MKKGIIKTIFLNMIHRDELNVASRRLKKLENECKSEEEREEIIFIRKAMNAYRRRQWRRFRAVALIVILVLVIVSVKGVVAIGSALVLPKNKIRPSGEKESAVIETENETETKEPLEADETTLTLSFTGDCILGTDEFFDYDTSFNAYYDQNGPDYFFKNVRDIFEKDDLTIVNMECVLTEETERADKEFAFKGEPEYVKVLSGSSVEAANMANNHSHDYGETSYKDTVSTLKKAGIETFGYDDVVMLNVKGVDVGIYGIYELDDHMERVPQLKANIQKLKDMQADIIVGIFHWSNELVTEPDENQLDLSKLAIDLGTDVIVGHHPHIVQGLGTYKDKTIVYSIGNFCFGGNTHPTEMDTFIYQHTFTVNKNREITAEASNVIPCWVSSELYYNNYQPTPIKGEAAIETIDKIKERSQGLNPPKYEISRGVANKNAISMWDEIEE